MNTPDKKPRFTVRHHSGMGLFVGLHDNFGNESRFLANDSPENTSRFEAAAAILNGEEPEGYVKIRPGRVKDAAMIYDEWLAQLSPHNLEEMANRCFSSLMCQSAVLFAYNEGRRSMATQPPTSQDNASKGLETHKELISVDGWVKDLAIAIWKLPGNKSALCDIEKMIKRVRPQPTKPRERVYSFPGPCGSFVMYPSNEIHYADEPKADDGVEAAVQELLLSLSYLPEGATAWMVRRIIREHCVSRKEYERVCNLNGDGYRAMKKEIKELNEECDQWESQVRDLQRAISNAQTILDSVNQRQ